MLLSILCSIFAPAVQLTGANLFADRERGSAVLSAWWPLSEPALAVGRNSPDAEVRRRCERATQTNWRADWAAAVLVGHTHEADGLPLADRKYVPGWRVWTDEVGFSHTVQVDLKGVSAWQLRSAVIRLAHAHGIDTSEQYYFGDNEFWSAPTGYDYVRLRMRGIVVGKYPDWSEPGKARMRAEWSALKGR